MAEGRDIQSDSNGVNKTTSFKNQTKDELHSFSNQPLLGRMRSKEAVFSELSYNCSFSNKICPSETKFYRISFSYEKKLQ